MLGLDSTWYMYVNLTSSPNRNYINIYGNECYIHNYYHNYGNVNRYLHRKRG